MARLRLEEEGCAKSKSAGSRYGTVRTVLCCTVLYSTGLDWIGRVRSTEIRMISMINLTAVLARGHHVRAEQGREKMLCVPDLKFGFVHSPELKQALEVSECRIGLKQLILR
jgi:hypothetical protein